MKIRRLAINTGGGDCPGLNAVIRAVVLRAHQRGVEVIGIEDGLDGLLPNKPAMARRLNPAEVWPILPRGGTILGTNNRGDPFARCEPALEAGFRDALAARGVFTHRRYSGGGDVDAACGQLAARS